MSKTNLLTVDVASHSVQGLKHNNEDSVGFFVPQTTPADSATTQTLSVETNSQLESKGIVLAVAATVRSAELSKHASNTAIKQLINDK